MWGVAAKSTDIPQTGSWLFIGISHALGPSYSAAASTCVVSKGTPARASAHRDVYDIHG